MIGRGQSAIEIRKNQLDGDMVNEVLKRYFETPGAEFVKLIKYSIMFKISG
jgi:hypothetical protein